MHEDSPTSITDLDIDVLCVEASRAVVNLAAIFTALVGPREVEDGNEEE